MWADYMEDIRIVRMAQEAKLGLKKGQRKR